MGTLIVYVLTSLATAISSDLEAGDMTQKAGRGSSVEQEMLTDVKAQNIRLGNLSQES